MPWTEVVNGLTLQAVPNISPNEVFLSATAQDVKASDALVLLIARAPPVLSGYGDAGF